MSTRLICIANVDRTPVPTFAPLRQIMWIPTPPLMEDPPKVLHGHSLIVPVPTHETHLCALAEIKARPRKLQQTNHALQGRKGLKLLRLSGARHRSAEHGEGEREGHEGLHHLVLRGEEALQHACRIANQRDP